MEWMADAGIQPSSGMYKNIVSFAQKSSGTECAPVIQERIGMLITPYLIYFVIEGGEGRTGGWFTNLLLIGSQKVH